VQRFLPRVTLSLLSENPLKYDQPTHAYVHVGI